ncbi:MAG: hypothetical protein OXC57_10360 [Rhodobacteraceae bacterium]|nr:hypothetical protein [Paracoccaceae bacterium]
MSELLNECHWPAGCFTGISWRRQVQAMVSPTAALADALVDNMVYNNQGMPAVGTARGEMVLDMIRPARTVQCLFLAALLATRLLPLHIGAFRCRGLP